jgi:hypothetical protein
MVNLSPFSLAFSLYDIVVPLVISSGTFCFYHDNHTTQCSVFLRVRAMTRWPSSIWSRMFVLILHLYACMPPAGQGGISPCGRFGLHSRLNDSRCYPQHMYHANPTIHTLWKGAACSTLLYCNTLGVYNPKQQNLNIASCIINQNNWNNASNYACAYACVWLCICMCMWELFFCVYNLFVLHIS